MKYCPNCLEEYQDSAKTCPDCNGVALVTEEDLAKRPEFRRVRGEDEDTTSYVAAGSAEDPFEADAFTSAVAEAGISVLTQPRRASSVDALTTGVARPWWWDIRVPTADRERAQAAIAARREALAAAEPEAEQAAEEEELETEKQ